MPNVLAVEYVDVFRRGVDSICKWLQLVLDADCADGRAPMEDSVRVEVEEELERLTVLSTELQDGAGLEQSTLERFIIGNKGDILAALEFYEFRLRDSMKAAQKDSYSPPFRGTRKELCSIELARGSLSLKA
jgi:hypothetical protein